MVSSCVLINVSRTKANIFLSQITFWNSTIVSLYSKNLWKRVLFTVKRSPCTHLHLILHHGGYILPLRTSKVFECPLTNKIKQNWLYTTITKHYVTLHLSNGFELVFLSVSYFKRCKLRVKDIEPWIGSSIKPTGIDSWHSIWSPELYQENRFLTHEHLWVWPISSSTPTLTPKRKMKNAVNLTVLGNSAANYHMIEQVGAYLVQLSDENQGLVNARIATMRP